MVVESAQPVAVEAADGESWSMAKSACSRLLMAGEHALSLVTQVVSEQLPRTGVAEHELSLPMEVAPLTGERALSSLVAAASEQLPTARMTECGPPLLTQPACDRSAVTAARLPLALSPSALPRASRGSFPEQGAKGGHSSQAEAGTRWAAFGASWGSR